MKHLNFFYRLGDYGMRTCPKHLVKLDPADENETAELVFYRHTVGGDTMVLTIGYFKRENDGWEFKFVGDRFKLIKVEYAADVLKMVGAAYDALEKWTKESDDDDP